VPAWGVFVFLAGCIAGGTPREQITWASEPQRPSWVTTGDVAKFDRRKAGHLYFIDAYERAGAAFASHVVGFLDRDRFLKREWQVDHRIRQLRGALATALHERWELKDGVGTAAEYRERVLTSRGEMERRYSVVEVSPDGFHLAIYSALVELSRTSPISETVEAQAVREMLKAARGFDLAHGQNLIESRRLTREAKELLDSGALGAAAQSLQRAMALDGNNDQARQLNEECQKKLAKHNEDQGRTAQGLISQARRAAQAEDYVRAVALLDQALAIDSSQAEAQRERATLATRHVKKCLDGATVAVQAKHAKSALIALASAQSVGTGQESISAWVKEHGDRLRKAAAEVVIALLNAEKYADAIDLAETACQMFPPDVDLKKERDAALIYLPKVPDYKAGMTAGVADARANLEPRDRQAFRDQHAVDPQRALGNLSTVAGAAYRAKGYSGKTAFFDRGYFDGFKNVCGIK